MPSIWPCPAALFLLALYLFLPTVILDGAQESCDKDSCTFGEAGCLVGPHFPLLLGGTFITL